MINEVSECHSLAGSPERITPGKEACSRDLGDTGAFVCMEPYKFSITMENTREKGYISEKLWNGIFGDTIPLYFGPNDISEYVNTDRIISCNVSQTNINYMRSMSVRKGEKWLFNKTNPYPSDNQLIKWAKSVLKDDLQSCINEFVELNTNDELWIDKVSNSILVNGNLDHSHLNGYVSAKGLYSMLKILKSPIFDDLLT